MLADKARLDKVLDAIFTLVHEGFAVSSGGVSIDLVGADYHVAGGTKWQDMCCANFCLSTVHFIESVKEHRGDTTPVPGLGAWRPHTEESHGKSQGADGPH